MVSRKDGSDEDQVPVVNIVAASDDGYARHLAIMLRSLLDRSRGRRIRCFIIVPDRFSSEAMVRSSVQDFAVDINFIAVTEDIISGLKLFRDVTIVAYYRLLMGDLIPSWISRVIYLDCDMILNSDIMLLWNIDLDSYTVAAVPDKNFEHKMVLGLADEERYFNSGVMLIDLIKWRQQGIGVRSLDFAARKPERLTWGDQCALNWVLRGKWLGLDARFNVQARQLGYDGKYGFSFYREAPSCGDDVAIVHFTGAPHPAYGKPWSYMCEHPFKSKYCYYARQTSWSDHPQIDLTIANVIRKYIRRVFPAAIPTYHAVRRVLKK